jgi:3-methyladenine DNA glycosylase AlkD
MPTTYKNIQKSLRQYATPERKRKIEWFFKTGKGQYGEGDEFIGVTNPDIRKVARQYKDINLQEIELLLHSPIHEDRLCALILLVNKNKKSTLEQRKDIANMYIVNLHYINNWDLVDLSANYILGRAIADAIKPMSILDKLANSPILWERRIAIISTMYFISKGDIAPSLNISKKLLIDKEDLIHKAVGWTLREAWKKSPQSVEQFLIDNYPQLPRTTLRYAIERFPEEKRLKFLRGLFSDKN